ncbi:regulator of chromosome condensation 1/beta-lactamase-inhibitor protein II, partial [Pavlovales sp. CCMP2436]
QDSLGRRAGRAPGEPAPLEGEALKSVRLVQIAAGPAHALAVGEAGELFGFGSNARGQLGITAGEVERRQLSFPTATRVSALIRLRVRSVSTGPAHTLALTDTGEVWSFGDKERGAARRRSCDDIRLTGRHRPNPRWRA